ncbi:MAG: WD40/YVTN/BNR-like repeat-containing protein, partial [Candidatus Kapaibacterium sp.]
DSLTIIGVGDSGLIVRTIDGGKHWEKMQQKKYWNFRHIDCKGNYGIAVGTYGTVAITTDAGKTWNIQEKRFSYLFNYAQCVSPQYMIAHKVFDCR